MNFRNLYVFVTLFWALFWTGVFVVVLSGCASRVSKVKTQAAQAVAPEQAETPARVDEQTVTIPAGSPVEIVREVIPADSGSKPETPPRVVETVKFTPTAETRFLSVRAESGTQRAPDVRTELAKVDASGRAPILYFSLGAAALCVVALFLRYPTPALLCGLASAGSFAAWRVSQIPSWVLGIAIACVALGAGLYFGFERGEKKAPA
jgi:hypothetical protein